MATTTTVDFEDPEQALPVLKKAYYELMMGGQKTRIRFGDREVQYSSGDLETLGAVITQMEADLAKANGDKPTRYAIKFGSFSRRL